MEPLYPVLLVRTRLKKKILNFDRNLLEFRKKFCCENFMNFINLNLFILGKWNELNLYLFANPLSDLFSAPTSPSSISASSSGDRLANANLKYLYIWVLKSKNAQKTFKPLLCKNNWTILPHWTPLREGKRTHSLVGRWRLVEHLKLCLGNKIGRIKSAAVQARYWQPANRANHLPVYGKWR